MLSTPPSVRTEALLLPARLFPQPNTALIKYERRLPPTPQKGAEL